MKCPMCQSKKFRIVDSRAKDFGIQRRRECRKCGHRFNTAEITNDEYFELRAIRLRDKLAHNSHSYVL